MRTAFCILLLVITPSTILSEDSVTPDGALTDLMFSFFPNIDMEDEILASLDAGHTTEVHYEARIYRRNNGLMRLFGDKLVSETTVLYEARWDKLNAMYIVTVNNERELYFREPEPFAAFMLSLPNQRISISEQPSGNIYLLCRAQIEPIRLVPPLTLMAFLLPKFRTSTPWTQIEFESIAR